MSTGVVIGRFQVPELHAGHKALIDYAYREHQHVTVLIGVAPFIKTKRNPLAYGGTYQVVKEYMEQSGKKYMIYAIKDKRTDEEWSKQVDTLIDSVVPTTGKAVLYTDRDGFNDHYSGRFPVKVVDLGINMTGTEVRKNIVGNSKSLDFRRGIIYAIEKQYPLASVCVDAIVRSLGDVLLVRKHNEDKWRFPGGFVDVEDTSLEHAVRRELMEEILGLNIYNDPVYKFSMQIKDWRSTLITNVFELEGTAYAMKLCGNEEIAEQAWFSAVQTSNKSAVVNNLVPEHLPIWEKYING